MTAPSTGTWQEFSPQAILKSSVMDLVLPCSRPRITRVAGAAHSCYVRIHGAVWVRSAKSHPPLVVDSWLNAHPRAIQHAPSRKFSLPPSSSAFSCYVRIHGAVGVQSTKSDTRFVFESWSNAHDRAIQHAPSRKFSLPPSPAPSPQHPPPYPQIFLS